MSHGVITKNVIQGKNMMHVKECQTNIHLGMVCGAGEIQEIPDAPPLKVRWNIFNEMILVCRLNLSQSHEAHFFNI